MCSLLAPYLGICQRQSVPFLAHFCWTAGEHFGAYQTDYEHPLFLVLWPLLFSINIPLGLQKQQSASLGYLSNYERPFPERSLGRLLFDPWALHLCCFECWNLGYFTGHPESTGVSSFLYPCSYFAQHSSRPAAEPFSNPAFVPTINKICTCHTDVFGDSNWMIHLFAVEQAYFIYAELLHLKEEKKGGNSKKRTCRKSYRHPCRLVSSLEWARKGGGPGARGRRWFSSFFTLHS